MDISSIARIGRALFCASMLFSGPAWADRGVTDTEIILGSHTSLSGPAATWGVPSINTARMLFDEVNESGGIHGRKIRLVVEDHQYQVPLAVRAANKLINRDGVFAMFLAVGTPHNNAVLGRQLAAGVPNLFPITGAISMVEPFHKFKFQALSSYSQQARASIRYFHRQRGHKRICAFYQDTDYGQEIRDAIQREVDVLGLEIVGETKHKPTETEFIGAMTSLKKANCDLIVFGAIIQDAILGYAAARELGIEADIVAGQASNDHVVASAPGGGTEGLYMAGGTRALYEETATAGQIAFIKKYKERYDEFPTVGTQYAYMPTRITIEALKKAGPDLTTDKLVAAIESFSQFDDGLGTPAHSYSATDHSGSDAVFLDQIQNGRLKGVERRIDLMP